MVLMTMSARLSLRQKFTSKQSFMRTRLRDQAFTIVNRYLGLEQGRSEELVTQSTLRVYAVGSVQYSTEL